MRISRFRSGGALALRGAGSVRIAGGALLLAALLISGCARDHDTGTGTGPEPDTGDKGPGEIVLPDFPGDRTTRVLRIREGDPTLWVPLELRGVSTMATRVVVTVDPGTLTAKTNVSVTNPTPPVVQPDFTLRVLGTGIAAPSNDAADPAELLRSDAAPRSVAESSADPMTRNVPLRPGRALLGITALADESYEGAEQATVIVRWVAGPGEGPTIARQTLRLLLVDRTQIPAMDISLDDVPKSPAAPQNLGTLVQGVYDGDITGYWANPAGDVNRDGLQDFTIGAAYAGHPQPTGEAAQRAGAALARRRSELRAVLESRTASRLDRGRAAHRLMQLSAYPNSAYGCGFVVFGNRGTVGTNGTLLLQNLDGANGFGVGGILPNALAGSFSAGIGDINADGFDDVLVAAPGDTETSPTIYGAAYLVFGGPDSYWQGIASAPGHNLPGHNLGYLDPKPASPDPARNKYRSVAGAMADKFPPRAGVVPPGGRVGTPVIVLRSGIGAAYEGDEFSHLVSPAGDVDDDGFPDFLIGCGGAGGLANRVYLLYGGPAWSTVNAAGAPLFMTSLLAASPAPGLPRATLFQSGSGSDFMDFLGEDLCDVGDFNGDGYADFVLGSTSDRAVLIFGKAGGFPQTVTLDTNFFTVAHGGIRYTATTPEEQGLFGFVESAAGDFNADGFRDVAISSFFNNAGAGKVSILFGAAVPPGYDVDVASLATPTQRVVFPGPIPNDVLGLRLGGAGTLVPNRGIDNSPYATAIFGAPMFAYADPMLPGAAYLVRGAPNSDWLSPLNPLVGVSGPTPRVTRFIGRKPYDFAGLGVAILGDVNGDDLNDFLIMAPWDRWGGRTAPGDSPRPGSGYLFYGTDAR